MMKIMNVFFATILIFAVFSSCEVLVNPSAEINVLQNDTEILSGDEYDFGQILVGESSSAVSFTIESLGNTKLILSGDPDLISVTGDTSDFVIDQSNVTTPLKPGESSDFTISFVPKSEGNKSVTISIANNDLDENLYTIVLKGEGTVPEINVKQGTTDIISGTGTFNFGEIKVGETSPEITFTIENTGTGVLVLTNVSNLISIQGADVSMFTVNQTSTQSVLQPGETTNFTVTFLPSSIWDKIATISIENTDFDENPYTFKVKGEGITAPEINIKQGLTDILSGSGEYDFGEILINESSLDIEFTIENLGTIDLELNPSPMLVSITGSDSTMFSVNDSITVTPVVYGTKSYFTISFQPTDPGIKTATIEIYSNDYDENPYTFTIKGKCLAPEINVKQGTTDIPSGTGSYDFGLIHESNPGKRVVFTIENLGDGLLKLTDIPDLIKISGPDSTQFSVDITATATNINPGDDTTFEIIFQPIKPGIFYAMLSIANNDPDENPYTFTIKARFSVNGDFNGDGIADVLVSAINNDEGGIGAGSVYIFFGGNNISSTINATNADVKLIGGDDYDVFGISVSNAGDINNDCIDDIIVGAHHDDDGGEMSGCAFIFFGRKLWNKKIDASNADVILIGEEVSDYFGIATSTLGDVNNDGIDDIIISAIHGKDNGNVKGCAYIFFGRQNWNSKIDSSNADVKLVGEEYWDSFNCVANVGDINGDGKNDVVVGAGRAKYSGGQQGRAYIFFGKNSWSNYISASKADVIIEGENREDSFANIGYSGDVNGDGLNDLVIGAGGYKINNLRTGAVYIFYGRKTWKPSISASNANVKIIGDINYSSFSNSLFVYDINSDGYDDIIVGAYEYYNSSNGKVYIFFGSKTLSSSLNAPNADVIISGDNQLDYFGYSTSSVYDINNDGIKDFVIGAIYDDDGGDNSGCAFIFFGRKTWSKNLNASNANVKLIGEATYDAFGYSVSGGR